MHCAFLELEALYLGAPRWESFSSFNTWTARLQLTISQKFNAQKFFSEKLLGKVNRKHQKFSEQIDDID